eukprot:8308292-Alexandrium_andersonii.AAC.1
MERARAAKARARAPLGQSLGPWAVAERLLPENEIKWARETRRAPETARTSCGGAGAATSRLPAKP